MPTEIAPDGVSSQIPAHSSNQGDAILPQLHLSSSGGVGQSIANAGGNGFRCLSYRNAISVVGEEAADSVALGAAPLYLHYNYTQTQLDGRVCVCAMGFPLNLVFT